MCVCVCLQRDPLRNTRISEQVKSNPVDVGTGTVTSISARVPETILFQCLCFSFEFDQKKDPFFLVRKKPFPEKHFGGIKTLMLPNQTLTVSYCVRVQVATIQPQSQNNLIVDTTVYFISFFWIFSLINLTKKNNKINTKKRKLFSKLKYLFFCDFVCSSIQTNWKSFPLRQTLFIIFNSFFQNQKWNSILYSSLLSPVILLIPLNQKKTLLYRKCFLLILMFRILFL